MTDPLETDIRSMAEAIDVPSPDLGSAMARGRALALRRRAGIVLITAALVGAGVFVFPKVSGTTTGLQGSPIPPSGTQAKEFTVLTITAEDEQFSHDQHFVYVTLESEGQMLVCFAFPTWVEAAAVTDESGAEVATFPGDLGLVQEGDDMKVGCASGDVAAFEHLALSPETHTLEIEGRGESIQARLVLRSSSDLPDRNEFDETTLLEYKATQALNKGQLDRARQLGQERLDRAVDGYEWDYGNAIHYGHLILGHVALREGDIETAKRELLRAGQTPGSPQLNSFGPNMSLARDLLLVDQEEVVLDYLELIDAFWDLDSDLDEWREQIQRGDMPNFSGQVGRGYLDPEAAS